jgi:hypothetical protein
MAFAEDLTPFFADFAVSATVGAATVSVIFDRAYVEMMGGVGGGIDASQPLAWAKSSDVAAQSIVRNSTLVIAGTTYYVQSMRPDGTGLTLLVLSTEAA